MSFSLSNKPLDLQATLDQVKCPEAGAYNIFVGAIRNHHDQKEVLGLKYDAHPRMTQPLGERKVQECLEKFDVYDAVAVHRLGECGIEDLAIIVVVASAHRQAAIEATEWLVDQIKFEVPIWKFETYVNESKWQDQPSR